MRQTKPKKSLCIRLFSSKLMFPLLLCIWLLYFAYARSQSTHSLRGGHPDFNPSEVYKTQLAPVKIVNLVIVAGHAVLRLNKLSAADTNDAAWYLLAYQKNQGFPAIISSHIKKGIDLAAADRSSLLVFSGGQTRKDVGPTSEAASYYYLADEKKWSLAVMDRVYLEEYARDSFENLLFSVCRFREVQGYYPRSITVVGFDFKGRRYADLHRSAIGFPVSNFTYVGLPSPEQFNQERAVRGEEDATRSFEADRFGCSDPALNEKRQKRNPFYRTVPYTLACPELSELLTWCGPGEFNVESLPWGTKRQLN
ncbi:hypothetical protein B484DRAFT_476628 [Ochromonadaceae sp. CCMP2298]|nr:hypothetical protein B484DRAFT_476628 [Ochromonadaceae sp. CCMP2298]|mmetsp:Transcript_14328/g.32150  ORF Transcript_14328/g.32150 Transcript_14328/m.32150 type:complete len:310 (+) Transcript_14328:105-1034(+)|eukprot:CAMPEP_0173252194 /NCGR_PEP_ID=MMETSP1142-20121109/20584_1 /TAXON_ID=483371 /ORGANISM="non described non described, Strain CCMP2298" /LENGTH=309 /DNA_ID=CAMNT_0014185195 /DNA_START=25 /DNA_END=954 /DNA_ORIENTATION=-